MATMPFFVVPTALGTITAGNALTSNPASHLAAFDAAGMTWKTSDNTNVWVRGDFGSNQSIDFIAMLAANAVPATTLRLRLGDTQVEVDGTADYDSGAGLFINPAITRTDGLYWSHKELAVQSERWWRVDMGSHTGAFEASMLIMGKKLTPSNWYSPGWGFGIDDKAKAEINRFGLVDLTPGDKLRTLKFVLGWISEAEMETMWRPFDELVGTSTPIYVCFDPTANTYRQGRSYFGLITENPFAAQQRNTPDGPRFERSFEITSLL
jgi:hypothetical protein